MTDHFEISNADEIQSLRDQIEDAMAALEKARVRARDAAHDIEEWSETLADLQQSLNDELCK